MKNMKKFVSFVLCLILIISLLSITAYADDGFLLHPQGTDGILVSGLWATRQNSVGQNVSYYFEYGSPFLLTKDLYSNHTKASIGLYDGSYWYYPDVSVDNLYFFPDHVRNIGESN
ncbi:MAG: hypothetical protein ACI3VD_02865 [Candidatus Limivicinus sp.]